MRLWRDRDFVLFWSGQSVSLTGSAVSEFALPLVALLTLHAGDLGVGAVKAAVYLPFAGLPLLAGAYVDRHRKRPILLGTNLARAVLVGAVPVLAWTQGLTLPVLCAVALIAGGCGVFFQVAEIAYVPLLVGRDRLLGANAAVQAVQSGAELAGPGLAGLLVKALGPAGAVAVDAASYVVSIATLGAMRHREPWPVRPVDQPRPVRREIADGLRFLWRTVPVRSAALQGMAFNAAWEAFTVPFMIYALDERRIGAAWWGGILALAGGASMLGAALAPRVARRLGLGRGIVVVSALTVPAVLAVPGADGPLWIVLATWAAAHLVTGFGVGLVNVLIFTLRARLTPAHLLGRVGASAQLLVFGALPVGAALGGVLAHALGNRPAMWLTAVVQVATIGLLVPLLRPDPPGADAAHAEHADGRADDQ